MVKVASRVAIVLVSGTSMGTRSWSAMRKA
jgi:hypothetical protein